MGPSWHASTANVGLAKARHFMHLDVIDGGCMSHEIIASGGKSQL